MADIFLSYASEDRDRVSSLVDKFEGKGWSVWWDKHLSAGQRFDAEIQSALDRAKCVVVVWSSRSVVSSWCRDEAQEGLDRQILVPLAIDEVRPPLGFRSTHTAALAGWPQEIGDLQNVLDSIEAHVGSSPSRSDVRSSASSASIAVMPFRNRSRDADQEFLSDGITEDILNRLTKLSARLIVRPASSTFSLKAENWTVASIGDRLGVTHVLEGSVRRSGDRIRVSAQLNEVAQNRSVWSNRYDRELTDVFELQDEITEQIVKALRIELLDSEKSRGFLGIEAYEAYLRGIYHNRRSQFSLAEQWFERATVLDASNANLWGERARQLYEQMAFGLVPNTGEHRKKAHHYVSRALAIESHHWSRAQQAMSRFIVDKQYQEAIDELAEVVTENPNAWEAWMYFTFAIGAIDRQSDEYFSAARLNSRLFNGAEVVGSTEIQVLIDSGRTDDARSVMPIFRATEVRYWVVREMSCRLAAVEKNTEELERTVDEWAKSVSSHPPRLTFYRALVAYLKGEFSGASDIVSKINSNRGYVPFLTQHEVALVERNVDKAADLYRKAVSAGEFAAMLWHRDTALINNIFPEFVTHPAYQDTLRQIHLDETSTRNLTIPRIAG